MGNVNETLKNVNSTLRTLLMMVLVGGAGYFGYVTYDLYNRPQKKLADKQIELEKTAAELKTASQNLAARNEEVVKLNSDLDEKAKQVERLQVAMQLLRVTRRVARLTVLDQRERPATATAAETDAAETDSDESPQTNLVTRVEFVETNEEGQPIGQAKQFDIAGDMVYVDYLRVSFDDKYVEEADLDRGTAICLFQRIFGEHQEPVDGYILDDVGTRPTAYARGSEMSDFEKEIWDDFWTFANDPERAEELGIRAIHGAAVSMRVQPGKTYELDLRSTGDMTFEAIATPQ
jgi:hypothetical protein